MKLTEQHVSDEILNALIDFANDDVKADGRALHRARLDALLELKQRRAEDRHREANNADAA